MKKIILLSFILLFLSGCEYNNQTGRYELMSIGSSCPVDLGPVFKCAENEFLWFAENEPENMNSALGEKIGAVCAKRTGIDKDLNSLLPSETKKCLDETKERTIDLTKKVFSTIADNMF